MDRAINIPVSYTHLDVYKRQAVKKGDKENRGYEQDQNDQS